MDSYLYLGFEALNLDFEEFFRSFCFASAHSLLLHICDRLLQPRAFRDKSGFKRLMQGSLLGLKGRLQLLTLLFVRFCRGLQQRFEC